MKGMLSKENELFHLDFQKKVDSTLHFHGGKVKIGENKVQPQKVEIFLDVIVG